MMNEITVLLVDDHQLVRKGFRRILEDDPDLRVVGEAGSGVEAIQMAERFTPRVIVMDMSMPGRPWARTAGRCRDLRLPGENGAPKTSLVHKPSATWNDGRHCSRSPGGSDRREWQPLRPHLGRYQPSHIV